MNNKHKEVSGGEMYKCQSYFDDENVLCDCRCGKCSGVRYEPKPVKEEEQEEWDDKHCPNCNLDFKGIGFESECPECETGWEEEKKCERCGISQSEWKGRWQKPLCKVGETSYDEHILTQPTKEGWRERYNYFVKDAREYGKLHEALATHFENFLETEIKKAREEHNEDCTREEWIRNKVVKEIREELKRLPAFTSTFDKTMSKVSSEAKKPRYGTNYLEREIVLSLQSLNIIIKEEHNENNQN